MTQKTEGINIKHIRIKNQIICAIFAALTAVLSQFIIPIAPVPINLGMMGALIAGGVLKPQMAALSQLIFVLVGAVGIPVFAGFGGGFGILMGPTGGYIIGYILMAWLIAFLITKSKNDGIIYTALSMLGGTAVCYALGTAWFMISTKSNLARSLMLCVVPFLIGDSLKIAFSVFISLRLKRIKQLNLQ